MRRTDRAIPDPDVIVAGAGPAGATAALLLARRGHRVTLLDRDAFPRDKVCGDLLGTYAIALLRRLEIELDVVRATPPLRGAFVHAPNGNRIGAVLDERTAQRLGARVIPRFLFDASLVAAAIAAGATFRQARVVDVVRDARGAIAGVALADGTTLRAPLTIGADGWASRIAQAIVATPRAACDIGIAARTYIDGLSLDAAMRFYVNAPGDGYAWVFPLKNGSANVGLGFVRGEPGADALAAAFERFLRRPEFGAGRERSERRTWPIPFGWRATPVCSAGALLVGDAASLASALSGSGIHTAIASASVAADIAAEALDRGDVSSAALAHYHARLRGVAARLRIERVIHRLAGTPAGAQRAIAWARGIPGAGRLAVPWLLNLG